MHNQFIQKKRILFLFYRSPFNSEIENNKRQELIYSTVKNICQAKILTFGSSYFSDDEQTIIPLKSSIVKKVARFLFLLKSARLTHYFSKIFNSALIKTIESFKPNYIYVEHLLMMQYVLNLTTQAKIIFFNDESNLYVQEKNLRGNVYQKLRNMGLAKFDIEACSKADHVITISEDEEKFLIQRGIKNTLSIPYGVDSNYFLFKWKKPEQNIILFVGDYSHYPNREAVKTITASILPDLAEYNIKLIIVGRNTHRIKKYVKENVKLYEDVDDIRQYYWNSAVFFAPIFTGAGMRVKVLEAALCGIPLIITPTANLGISLRNEVEAFICNSPNEMINKLKDLFDSSLNIDLAKMRISARQRIVNSFEVGKVRLLITNKFEKIIQNVE